MANCQNNMYHMRRPNGNSGYIPNSSCNMGTAYSCRNDKCNGSGKHAGHAAPCSEITINAPLAMAYVPWQKWCGLYDLCKGFERGTIFSELDKPFLGKGGRCR